MGTRVALDAMGGDQAPAVNVEGAVAAARELGLSILLVGEEREIARSLERHSTNGLGIAICHAPETVGMQESPSAALRKKKRSSIRIGLELVKRGDADAFISAGNTGAVMATALFTFGPVPGVERPAIALTVPTLKGHSILIDVGANVDCKPRHLLQFAIMGDVYARQIIGKTSPTVGLLSIGEEESKGNELTREAFKALEEQPSINFIGNVEGREVFSGAADIIVCDGFTGNVALKISESAVEFFTVLLKEELSKGVVGKVGALLARNAFLRFKKRVDYTEYGGAPLLGVKGVCVISHGRSTAKAIKNAIRVAAECAESRVIEHIREGVAVSA
jgi:glycerol-3-phosphate acyltransferase PlsX